MHWIRLRKVLGLFVASLAGLCLLGGLMFAGVYSMLPRDVFTSVAPGFAGSFFKILLLVSTPVCLAFAFLTTAPPRAQNRGGREGRQS